MEIILDLLNISLKGILGLRLCLEKKLTEVFLFFCLKLFCGFLFLNVKLRIYAAKTRKQFKIIFLFQEKNEDFFLRKRFIKKENGHLTLKIVSLKPTLISGQSLTI